MGKNHRHKKLLKSEKAKVKLRTKTQKTKFLPKGANVTDTTFKIKPIVVQEQLKAKSEAEPLSRRKLNVKELLLRLKHHSVAARKDSCVELRQIIGAFADEIVGKHFSQILQETCPLVLDRESSVRKEAVRLLDTLLSNITLEKAAPFFNVLSSYVRCATTHIDVAIQEDSLLLVDVLLKRAPSLVAKESDRLLPNFFNLLQKFRAHGKVGFGQKSANMNWKLKILQRVNDILEVAAFEDPRETKETVIMQKVENKSCFPIFSLRNFTKPCPSDFLNTSNTLESSDENKQDYLDTLLPLLHETWLEVIPETKHFETKQDVTVLKQETATVLNSILKATQSLFKYYKSKGEFKSQLRASKDLQKFMAQILKQFPYSQEEIVQKKNVSSTKCTAQNLSVCYLFCVLNTTLHNRNAIENAGKIFSYLEMCLLNRNYIPEVDLQLLMVTLRTILIDNFGSWEKKNLPLERLLNNVIHYYNNAALKRNVKDVIFNLLCDVIDNSLLNSSTQYQVFLSTLPSLLCKATISERVIDMLLSIAKQGNQLFYRSFLKKLPTILENLPNLRVGGTSDDARIKVFALFFYIPVLYKENIEDFISFLKQCKDPEVLKTLKEILKLRCELVESENNIKMLQDLLY